MPPTSDPSRTAARAARGAALLAGALAALLALAWWWAGRVVPPLDGRIQLAGLRAPVEVRFDRFAIPHIYAVSDRDAWLAVGYLQARDRLWQMELYRRAASGRLSELLGDATMAIDRRFLTLGLRAAAEREWAGASSQVRVSLERHTAGVNLAMTAGRGKLPLEFQLLRIRPEPWTPVDSLAIGKLFAWRLGENHRAELLRYLLTQELGPRAGELLPGPPEWAPVILDPRQGTRGMRGTRGPRGTPRPGGMRGEEHVRSRPDLMSPALSTKPMIPTPLTYPTRPANPTLPTPPTHPGLDWLSGDGQAATNSWVLHGSRTATGRPLLANDPHLPIEMPSVWWEAHIVGSSFNVTGVTIPGIPFVIIGHNDRLGWGVSNVGADVQDFLVERLDPSRQRYRVGDAWEPLTTTRHQIRVRGRTDPLTFDVLSTRNGPILNAIQWSDPVAGDGFDQTAPEETVLAFKWAAIEAESAAAFELLGRARDWDGFLAAIRRFAAPSQHFVYADVDGNIGYATSGLMPVRSRGDGSFPAEGWSNAVVWSSMIPPADLPAILNPPSGQIVTGNNEVHRRLPFSITRDWVAPYRAMRVLDLLGERRGLSIQDMTRIQSDILSLSADRTIDAIASARTKSQGTKPEVTEALHELAQWDRRVDSRPVVFLYEAFEEALWRRTFADEMSSELFARFYRYAANERYAGLQAILEDAASSWFDDRGTREIHETRDEIVLAAAGDALESLRARFGDRSKWRWDEAHALTFSHALSGGGRPLAWLFNRGPIPLGGDGMTVNKTATNLRRPYQTSEAASYRQILDVGEWDRSLAVNTTGQSGHPLSPHYFDQNEMWRHVHYRAMPFSRSAVEAATVSQLELVP